MYLSTQKWFLNLNQATFWNLPLYHSLKELTDPLDLTDQACSSLVVDGGWLLYMVKWEQGQTWQEIADSYLSYVQCLGRRSQKITVVFDGYNSSPKDHEHIRRTKNSCCDLQIRPDMIHLTPKAKFMDNTHNKSELIHLLSSTFRKCQITVEQCDNDADTSIVRAALAAATDDSVEVSKILCRYFTYINYDYFWFVSVLIKQNKKTLTLAHIKLINWVK